MTADPRKAVFDAAKAAGAVFSTNDAVAVLDDALTALGVPQAHALLEPSEACAKLVRASEGCRLTAYPDPGTGGDPWTIGWGSTGEGIKRGVVWTQAQADARFAADLKAFGKKVLNLLADAPTTQNQFDALCSLSYNIGIANFGTSTLLKKHKAGDYAGAAAQFPLWNKGGGKVLPGLVARRAAERALYEGRA